ACPPTSAHVPSQPPLNPTYSDGYSGRSIDVSSGRLIRGKIRPVVMDGLTRIGPYEVIRKLGSGGMGEVYEARHTAIERRVAIKVLRAELAKNPEVNSRFINEARAVNIVDHPGIVQISDY